MDLLPKVCTLDTKSHTITGIVEATVSCSPSSDIMCSSPPIDVYFHEGPVTDSAALEVIPEPSLSDIIRHSSLPLPSPDYLDLIMASPLPLPQNPTLSSRSRRIQPTPTPTLTQTLPSAKARTVLGTLPQPSVPMLIPRIEIMLTGRQKVSCNKIPEWEDQDLLVVPPAQGNRKRRMLWRREMKMRSLERRRGRGLGECADL